MVEQRLWELVKAWICLLFQVPVLGSEGMLGAGLSCDQRRLLQRFRPELAWRGAGVPHSPESLLQNTTRILSAFLLPSSEKGSKLKKYGFFLSAKQLNTTKLCCGSIDFYRMNKKKDIFKKYQVMFLQQVFIYLNHLFEGHKLNDTG